MSFYSKLLREVSENDLPESYCEICSQLLLVLVSIVNFSCVEMPRNVILFSLAFSLLLYLTSVSSSSCKTVCKTPFIIRIILWLFVKYLVRSGDKVLFDLSK